MHHFHILFANYFFFALARNVESPQEQFKSRAAHPQATMVNHLVPTKRNNNKIQGINLLIISLCFHPKFIFIA